MGTLLVGGSLKLGIGFAPTRLFVLVILYTA